MSKFTMITLFNDLLRILTKRIVAIPEILCEIKKE